MYLSSCNLVIDINRTKTEVKMEWNKHGKQNEGKLKKINGKEKIEKFYFIFLHFHGYRNLLQIIISIQCNSR